MTRSCRRRLADVATGAGGWPAAARSSGAAGAGVPDGVWPSVPGLVSVVVDGAEW
ncbi:MAG: hypothetical protein U0S48_16675 [Solirubrobacteraceae bacterium]